MSTNRPKQLFQGLPHWNTLEQWQRVPSMQYHTITTDRNYQLLFFVSFVELQLAWIVSDLYKLIIDILIFAAGCRG